MLHGLVLLILMLVAVGALLCATAVGLAALALVHPPRMTDGKALWLLRRLSPQDLGLPFAEMRFQVRDERGKPLNIASWWIPHPSAQGRCAVLLHGYADAKVGAIAWAPVWYAMGFNLLVPDLRAHGESSGSTCTAGYFERDDLRQVLDDLRVRRPDDTQQIVLFGVSMGGAVAAAAAQGRDDIAAVVLDSPYPDFPTAAIEHMARLGLPGRWLAAATVRCARWITTADFDLIATTHLIEKLPCPVLIIQSESDSFLTQDHRDMLERAASSHSPEFGPAEVWTVPAVDHLMAMSADPRRYQDRLEQFLQRALRLGRVG